MNNKGVDIGYAVALASLSVRDCRYCIKYFSVWIVFVTDMVRSGTQVSDDVALHIQYGADFFS